jgi:hypothetical protein
MTLKSHKMEKESLMGCLLTLGVIVESIVSGVLAWNWVEPESFGGGVGFIIIWGIFSYIGYLIIGALGAILEKMTR